MLLFLVVFLCVYGAMHVLVFWGVQPLLSGHPYLPTLAACWMGMMVLAPILVRYLDRSGQVGAARAIAWVGNSWMGFLFLAFCLFLLVALWHLLALLLARLLPDLPVLTLHRPAAAAVVLLAVLAVGLYGVYEAAHLRVERIRLASAKLPPQVGRLRIVQISDLHLGLIHREETLAPLIAAVTELAPDLVVATGDIVDAQIDNLEDMSGLWRRLEPPLGKYAVTGNHEFYAGHRQALEFLRHSGFRVLRGETAMAGDALQLVGVDDPAGGGEPVEVSLLKSAGNERFTILLKHRPLVDEQALGLFDLQLSGHAHRGQIFPFGLLTGLHYPMQNGLYRLAGGSDLYTSRGTGTWGPPMRVGSPPEVTLFEISRIP